MSPAETTSHLRAALRLVGLAALVALLATTVLAASAPADTELDLPQQTDPSAGPVWSMPPDAADDANEGEIDEPDTPDAGGHGGPLDPGDDDHGRGGERDPDRDGGDSDRGRVRVRDGVSGLSGAQDWPEWDGQEWERPDWDAPRRLRDEPAPVTTTYVSGTKARLRTDGRAAIPRGAPKRVRALIYHLNNVVGKRKGGGGQAKLVDNASDGAGAVSYGLIKTRLLQGSLVSGSFVRWAEAGSGRWVTVYASRAHVYIEVAGLRLDTSVVGDHPSRTGVRWRPTIGKRVSFKSHHPAGL